MKSTHKIMTEKYRDLCKWLKFYPVTDVQIKEIMPEHYQKLQDAIETMDSSYYKEDLQEFNENMERVINLYFHAVCVISPVQKVNSVN